MYRTPYLPSTFLFSPFLSPLSPSLHALLLARCINNHVLASDEVVQFTEQDEWAYREMAAHIPLCSHPNPRSVSGVHIGGATGMSLHSCFHFSLFLLCLFSHSPSSSSLYLLPHLILYPVPLLHFLSCLHLFLPTTFLTLIHFLPPYLPRCWW